jgi:1-phosphofructokinase family hexose kinase
VTSFGGKGTNVSRALKLLGIDSTAYGFIGGGNGETFLKLLEPCGIHTDFTHTRCETRMNVKIIPEIGEPTEFNESGGPVGHLEKDSLLEKIEGALGQADLFFMGGSVPAGIGKNIYKDILDLGAAKNPKTKFIVDCDGEALKLCMENSAKPFAIKPNRFEFEQFSGKKFDLDENFERGLGGLKEEAKKIYEKTGIMILCSLGEYGGVYCGAEGVFYANAPKVELMGFTGAGDTFLSAFCAAYFGLFELSGGKNGGSAALSFAVAAASAKVKKPGTEFATACEMVEMYERTTKNKI